MGAPDHALYRLEPLAKHHDRETLHCGVNSLDLYLKTQASQDMRRKANAVFALVPEDFPTQIAGYFTLCAYGLAPGTIPEAAQKYIPRYPMVSATLMGRLAVATELQGLGLGTILLAKALEKAYENAAQVGSSMVVVDAIDKRAAKFYAAHGFIQLPDSMRLILPMQTITALIQPERRMRITGTAHRAAPSTMILLDPDLDPESPHGLRPVRGGHVPASRTSATKTATASVLDKNKKIPSVRTLARFLALAQKTVRLRGEVNVQLTTDAAIRKLNRQFRGTNKATDVLSFPADGSFPAACPIPGTAAEEIAGDLTISVETARKQAVAQNHSLSTEIKVLMLHGLLHLAGYDHETDEGQMGRRERLLRAKLKLPQGLIERAVSTGKTPVLKGHGFSRAAKGPKMSVALAAEGRSSSGKIIPQGLKPGNSGSGVSARLKSCPFKALEPKAQSVGCPILSRSLRKGGKPQISTGKRGLKP